MAKPVAFTDLKLHMTSQESPLTSVWKATTRAVENYTPTIVNGGAAAAALSALYAAYAYGINPQYAVYITDWAAHSMTIAMEHLPRTPLNDKIAVGINGLRLAQIAYEKWKKADPTLVINDVDSAVHMFNVWYFSHKESVKEKTA